MHYCTKIMLCNHPTAALCSWLNWFLFNSNKTFCLKACNSFCYTICGFSIIGAIINFLELPKEAVKNKRNHEVIVRGVVIEELIHTWLACIEFRGGEWGNLGVQRSVRVVWGIIKPCIAMITVGTWSLNLHIIWTTTYSSTPLVNRLKPLVKSPTYQSLD